MAVGSPRVTEMQGQLPGAMKAKLERQVLVQRKEVYSGATPGSMVDSDLKNLLPFLLKPVSLVGIGRGELFFFYPIILLAFGVLRPRPFIFLDFGMLGPYTFILPAFGVLSVRTSPCRHLGQ